jgi:hypothetical protein
MQCYHCTMKNEKQENIRKQKIANLVFSLEYASLMTATDVRSLVRKVCKKAGVDYTTYWRWKTKGVMPDVRTYRKLMSTAHDMQRHNPYLKDRQNDPGHAKD